MKFNYTNVKTSQEEEINIYPMSVGKIIKLEEEGQLLTSFDAKATIGELLKAKLTVISYCCDEDIKEIENSFDMITVEACFKESLKVSGFEITTEKKTIKE